MHMKRLKSLAFVYASIFSLLIGLGAGIFLTISSELISLFWSKRTLIVISRTFQLSLDQLILGGTEMTDKLINDASETKRAKFNFWSALIGGGLMVIGFICFLIKANSVEYIDKQGFLHENFYLLPLGYLFLLSGLLVILVSGVSYLFKLHKLRKKQN